LIEIKVYKGEFTPYEYKHKAYMRRDTATVAVDRVIMNNLILEGRNCSYEEMDYEAIDYENGLLSFRTLETALMKAFYINALTDDLLVTLNLKSGDRYNHAAALLSDRNPLTQAKIQLVAFEDETVLGIKDRMTLENFSVLEQFEACLQFYHKHINKREIIDSAYRKTIEEVPLVAYREAVANLILHRDYSIDFEAKIEIFSDRIEIISPGGLPIGLSEKDYLEGRISKPRNRIISDIFLRLKIIEKLATGIRRIKVQYRDSKTKPQFIVGEYNIVVILPKINYKRDVPLKSRKETLAERDKEILNVIQTYPSLSRKALQSEIELEKSQTVQILKRLLEEGYIKKNGNGPSTTYSINH